MVIVDLESRLLIQPVMAGEVSEYSTKAMSLLFRWPGAAR